jgi:alkylation response protein AidB-like acyl-CoA dehydrogenase
LRFLRLVAVHGGKAAEMFYKILSCKPRAATIAAGTSQIQRNIIAGLMGLKV